jgi:protein-L-isoaspartate(D-aspartate) O-methyltransferase
VADDAELGEISCQARTETLARRSWTASGPLLDALGAVPRERFVAPEDIGRSADDCALRLTEDEGSTLSALHAYAAALTALGLEPGDELVELGSGNGYGAMLASVVVGPYGKVLSLELEGGLAAQAKQQLAELPQSTVLRADAHETQRWQGASKVYVAFSMMSVPDAWLDALADEGKLVAPVGPPAEQILTLFEKIDGTIRRTEIGPVCYVPDRTV